MKMMTEGMNMIRKGIVSIIIFSAIMGITMAGIGNEQPVAKAAFSPQGCFACECKEIVLDASGSGDSDGQIVNYDWYYNSKLVTKGKIVSLGKEFCDNPGTYRIKLVVTDNGGLTDDYELEFIVKNNPVPTIKEIKIINAKDFYVMGDEIPVSVVLNNLGRGSSYGKLNYVWDYDPEVFQKIGNGGEVIFKVIPGQVLQTNYKIGVVVSNACGKKSQREEIELEIRSLKPGSSLKTEIILPPEIYEGKRFRAESSCIPEQGDKITYLWKLFRVLSDKEALIKQSSEEKPSFTIDDSEVYKLTLEITNRYGAKGSAFKDFGVINRINDEPVANASATQRQVLFGKEIILNGNLSWDDGEIEFYCWFDKSYGENLGCSRSPILKVTFNRSGPHEIVLTVKDNGPPKKNENDFPKFLSDTDAVMISVIKSSSAVSSQTPTPIPTFTATPSSLNKTYYPPSNPTPPPPKKESNKIPGMEFGMTIAVIITTVVFIRRRRK